MGRTIGFLGFFALLSAAQAAGPQRCFLGLDRPLNDHAAWSAQCGGSPGVGGRAFNRLDRLSSCVFSSPASCSVTPGLPVKIDPRLMSAAGPPEPPTTLPSCYPPSHPSWVRIGYLEFNRSCFRAIPDADRAALLSWAGSQSPSGDACQLDELGQLARDKMGNDPLTPAQLPWAHRFAADYPAPHGSAFGTAAEAIYDGFRLARQVTDTCLDALNPDLASRVREAMGVQFRAVPASPPTSFPPTIDCREQLALSCAGPQSLCDQLRSNLEPLYAEGPENRDQLEGQLQRLRLQHDCRPAHPSGVTLGSVESSNLRHGAVAVGSPRISIFNPTALFNKLALTGGPSTLFHEFLHAAGAQEAPSHNDGFLNEQIPPRDQVYACQAIAFKAFFEHVRTPALRAACLTCVDPRHRAICGSPSLESDLESLGCRRH